MAGIRLMILAILKCLSAAQPLRPLAVLNPAFNTSSLGPSDWLPLVQRMKEDSAVGDADTKNFLFFYNQTVYPDELLVHVHIPKTGGTTFFKLFNSRNCGYSTYKLKYRSYRILRRIERNRRENSARKATSDCGFFSHEFPSYNEAKLFLTPPINVFDDHSGYIRTGSTPSAHNGGQLELATSARLRDMTILREPRSHVISAFGHFQRIRLPNCSNITDVTENKCKLFQFGDMRNKQTNVLGGGNLTIATRNLESMFYIGILEYYDLSICLLSFQLGQYNTERCSCRSRESKDLQSKKIAPTKNAAQNQLEFGEDELQRIDLITGVDNLLYKYGIELFFVRVRQAEAMLGDSILCKWKN